MRKRIMGLLLCASIVINIFNTAWADENDNYYNEFESFHIEEDTGFEDQNETIQKEDPLNQNLDEHADSQTDCISKDDYIYDTVESEESNETEENNESELSEIQTELLIPESALNAQDTDLSGQLKAKDAGGNRAKSGNLVKVGIIDTDFKIDDECIYSGILNTEQSVQIINGIKSPITDDSSDNHGTTVAEIFTNACGTDKPLDSMVDLVLVDIAPEGGKASVSDMCEAISYLADLDVDIINISLGYSESVSNEVLDEVCRYVSAGKGISIVCAEGYGNSDGVNTIPARYDTTICVAADANIYSGSTGYLDYVVPGTDNSYAAPEVTAALALLKFSNSSDSSIWSAERILQMQGKIVRYLNKDSSNSSYSGFTVDDITANYQKEQFYTKEPVCPEIALEYNGMPLYENKDYYVNYSNNIEKGDAARIEITGKTFIGRKVFDFTIKESVTIHEAEVSLKDIFYTYTGNAIEPKPERYEAYDSIQYEYENNVECGTANGKAIKTIGDTVYIEKFKFFIVDDQTDIWKDLSVTYNKQQKIPDWEFRCSDINVSYNGVKLSEDYDYTVEYHNIDHIGNDAEFIIKGRSFTGEKSFGFELVPNNIGVINHGSIGSFVYTGDSITPKLDYYDTDEYWWWQLFIYADSHNEITYEYTNNRESGIASGKAIITGLVEGEIHFTFKIEKKIENLQGNITDTIKWSYDDNGTLRIYGEGPLDRSGTDAEDEWKHFLANYGEFIETICIDEGVTSIENTVFGVLDHVKEVRLPDSVTYIANKVFANWRGLENVVNYNPAAVAFPLDTFYGTPFYLYYLDSNTDAVDLPANEEIIDFEFEDDSLSYRLFIKTGLLQIQEKSMNGDMSDLLVIPSHNWKDYVGLIKSISILNINNKRVYLDDCAFINLRNLETVRISDGLIVYVGDRAFEGCESLMEFSAAKSATGWVGAYSFARCRSLKHFYFTFSNTVSIGKESTGAFLGCCNVENMKIIAPYGIPAFAFYGCTNLKEVRFWAQVDYTISIGEYAFAKCENLESFELAPYSVNEVKPYAFADCSLFDADKLKPDVVGLNAFANTQGKDDGVIAYPLDNLLDQYHKNYSYSRAEDNALMNMVTHMIGNSGQSYEEPVNPNPDNQSSVVPHASSTSSSHGNKNDSSSNTSNPMPSPTSSGNSGMRSSMRDRVMTGNIDEDNTTDPASINNGNSNRVASTAPEKKTADSNNVHDQAGFDSADEEESSSTDIIQNKHAEELTESTDTKNMLFLLIPVFVSLVLVYGVIIIQRKRR